MRFGFSKVREVISPNRTHEYDAGIDFFIPKFTDEFFSDIIEKNKSFHKYFKLLPGKITLFPNSKILIPSGIKLDIPEGYALMGFNKSGVSFKKGLHLMSQVIDSGYQGELYFNFLNTSTEKVDIFAEEKIIQFLLMPVNITPLVEYPIDDLYIKESTRGEGGFGSTGV